MVGRSSGKQSSDEEAANEPFAVEAETEGDSRALSYESGASRASESSASRASRAFRASLGRAGRLLKGHDAKMLSEARILSCLEAQADGSENEVWDIDRLVEKIGDDMPREQALVLIDRV